MTQLKTAFGLTYCALLAVWTLTACGGSVEKSGDPEKNGTLDLPLTSYGASGVQYRLRDAAFDLSSQSYYGGGGAGPTGMTVYSETNPDAPSIEMELEQGSYQVHLNPGWHMERVENGIATPVDAQLLNGEWQWTYVSPHSTTWVSYQFGIGGRALWFNGKVNIGVEVFENPDQYYGYGPGGAAGAAGASFVPGGAPGSGAAGAPY